MRRELVGILQEGRNELQISITPYADDTPCAVYLRGQASRFRVVSNDARRTGGAVEATVGLQGRWDHEAGTILRARQWATNKAGLASVVQSEQRVMVDDTRPVHAAMHLCAPGGRYYPTPNDLDPEDAARLGVGPGHVASPLSAPSHLGYDGGRFVYYQSTVESLRLCWDAPGFYDDESGVWTLEWQLARWVNAPPGSGVVRSQPASGTTPCPSAIPLTPFPSTPRPSPLAAQTLASQTPRPLPCCSSLLLAPLTPCLSNPSLLKPSPLTLSLLSPLAPHSSHLTHCSPLPLHPVAARRRRRHGTR